MKDPKKKVASKKAAKPKASIRFVKCVHTFKCMFNDDCESLARAELWQMTPEQLEYIGRRNGIELDRRKSKATLVSECYEAM
jgi:hypothetical protein